MRRFQVTVNGTAYDVAVEETASDAGSVQPEVALQQEHSTEKQAVPDGTPISAPMTGTILELQVQVGDAVQSGQTVAVLEAMKMANDLVAPENGVIERARAGIDEAISREQLIPLDREKGLFTAGGISDGTTSYYRNHSSRCPPIAIGNPNAAIGHASHSSADGSGGISFCRVLGRCNL